MLSELAGGLTGPLAACVAWVVAFAGLGLHIGYLITKREGAVEALASRLGIEHLAPGPFVRQCTFAFGAVGLASGLLLPVAATTGSDVELPPEAAALLVAFLLGAAISTLLRTPQAEDDRVGIALVGGWIGVGLALLVAAASQYREVSITLSTGIAAGALLGVGWLAIRGPVGAIVRPWTGRARRAQVGLVGTELAGAAVGFADALALVVIGAPSVPIWVLLGLLAALAPALVVAQRRFAPPTVHAYRVELAGFSTTVLERDGDGPPILLLHGYGVTAEIWRQFMQLFPGHRLVAVDLPSISDGADPLRPGEPMLPQLKEFAAAAVTDLFPGQEPIAISLSLGGYLSLDLVRRGLITRAIVVGTAGIAAAPWMDLANRAWIVRPLSALGRTVPPGVRGEIAVRGYRYGNRHATQLAIDTVRQRARDPEVLRTFVEGGAQLVRELLADPIDIRTLPGIVHFVWGEKDTVSPPARAADRVRRLRPDLPLDILDGLAHTVFRNDVHRFIQLVQRSPVLARTRPRRTRPPARPAATTAPAGAAIAPPSAGPRRSPITRRTRVLLGAAAGVGVAAAAGLAARQAAARRRSR